MDKAVGYSYTLISAGQGFIQEIALSRVFE